MARFQYPKDKLVEAAQAMVNEIVAERTKLMTLAVDRLVARRRWSWRKLKFVQWTNAEAVAWLQEPKATWRRIEWSMKWKRQESELRTLIRIGKDASTVDPVWLTSEDAGNLGWH